jgi:hypothetical protein
MTQQTKSEPVHYQVWISGQDGKPLAFKKDDVWTINAPIEEVLNTIFETLQPNKKNK